MPDPPKVPSELALWLEDALKSWILQVAAIGVVVAVAALYLLGLKEIFLGNGFRLVYDNDLGEPLADGFYFTLSYPGFDDGADLIVELLHYGISAITLETTGSCRKEGLRACVSLTGDDLFATLEQRVRAFHQDHPIED